MNIFENYKIGAKCEYLRQHSPDIWREAIITDVSIKNRQVSVVTDTGNHSTHNIDNVRIVFNLPNIACSGLAGTARLESEVAQPANR